MNILRIITIIFLITELSNLIYPQSLSDQDSLLGSITSERIWWDLQYYHLNIVVDPDDKTIVGQNLIRYEVLTSNNLMQIDLQEPMNIVSVLQDDEELKFERVGSVYYVELTKDQILGEMNDILVVFGGMPTEAEMPPWVGGITWSKDKNGNHFIASSCQGEGASIWWPCKDHMYDEPDSMLITVTNPSTLTNVSNGRLRKVILNTDGTATSHWFVSNPINNYGVNINIGDYVHFSEKYYGERGFLDCDYYVLSYNLEKAKSHFKEVPKMLKAFEYWFGPYPFYEDSYKLVEAPYLGMEHQSSVTYGNGYKNGFRGKDVSGTGWGNKFDFIIVHESGHEWFANSITYKDVADMWIHEGFTAYSENLFVDYHFGTEACNEYVQGTRKNIKNDKPIIGKYNYRSSGSGDMYSKGASILHTLRQIVNDDEKWRNILRDINLEFYHQTVTTNQIEEFLSKKIGIDLQGFFDIYLRQTIIPNLEYEIADNDLRYRWTNTSNEFSIPLRIYIDNKEAWITPSNSWQEINCPSDQISIDFNYYITANELTAPENN